MLNTIDWLLENLKRRVTTQSTKDLEQNYAFATREKHGTCKSFESTIDNTFL